MNINARELAKAQKILPYENVLGDGSCALYAVYKSSEHQGILQDVKEIFNVPKDLTYQDRIDLQKYKPGYFGQEDLIFFGMRVRIFLSTSPHWLSMYHDIIDFAKDGDFGWLKDILGNEYHNNIGIFNADLKRNEIFFKGQCIDSNDKSRINYAHQALYAEYLQANLVKKATETVLKYDSWANTLELQALKDILKVHGVNLHFYLNAFVSSPSPKILIMTNGAHFYAFYEGVPIPPRNVQSWFENWFENWSENPDDLERALTESKKEHGNPAWVENPGDLERALTESKKEHGNPASSHDPYHYLTEADALAVVEALKADTKTPPCKLHDLRCHTRKFMRRVKEKHHRARSRCRDKKGWENFLCHLFA